MNTTHLHSSEAGTSPTTLARTTRQALASLFVVVGFYVLREHWSHALGFAPYLLLLACPLLHLFGHHHHGHADRS